MGNKVGRPAGAVKTEKIEVMIRPEMKAAFKKHLQVKGSNSSTKICEWIAEYLQKEGVEINEK